MTGFVPVQKTVIDIHERHTYRHSFTIALYSNTIAFFKDCDAVEFTAGNFG